MNQSVLKALDILNLFSEQRKQLTLTSISQELDMPKPTAYRMLSAMEQQGFIKKHKKSEHDSHYTLGMKLLTLGQLVKAQLDIRHIASPHMQILAEKITEDVHLLILDGQDAVYIEKAGYSTPYRINIHIGSRLDLYDGAAPMLLLAHQPELFVENYLTSHVLTEAREPYAVKIQIILEELKAIRSKGYCIQHLHSDHDYLGIAYPVFNTDQKVAGALSVLAPTLRFIGKEGESIQADIEKTAHRISADLGFQPANNLYLS